MLDDVGCELHDGLLLARLIATHVTLDLRAQLRLPREVHNQLGQRLRERHAGLQQHGAVGRVSQRIGAGASGKTMSAFQHAVSTSEAKHVAYIRRPLS
jgi:hypothetical protein